MFLQSKENFDAALRVLHKHSNKLDPLQVSKNIIKDTL